VKSLNPATTLIQSMDSRSAAIVLTTTAQNEKPSDVAKLVFNRYGDQYFLSKIWPGSSPAGRGLPKSRLEREVAKGLSTEGTTVIAAESVPKK
jgi:hypothetical protein